MRQNPFTFGQTCEAPLFGVVPTSIWYAQRAQQRCAARPRWWQRLFAPHAKPLPPKASPASSPGPSHATVAVEASGGGNHEGKGRG
jgi:hypothetical protein